MLTCIRGADVVTMNSRHEVLSATDIWIEDSEIIAFGKCPRQPDHVIDAADLVAIPGLIQPHIHLCQTLARGIADDMALLEWLRDRIFPMEDPANALRRSGLRLATSLSDSFFAFVVGS
jgi:cytosine/adenosine deaminase-related metal-dependent hydrolase